jgi:hypothetical protein
MGELGTAATTLVDVAKRLDPDGTIADIAELLAQMNPMLQDMAWKESNLPTSHRTTVRTTLPTVGWRTLNTGSTPSKSTTGQAEDSLAILDAWFEVDKHIADLNGNTEQFRLSESTAFVEAMAQEVAGTVIYGNVGTAPEEFTGLAPRYNSLSGTTASNVITGGGGSGGDNSSIWLVGWGDEKIFGIYPKGSKAGLVHENLGLVTVETTAGVGGTRMRAYQDHWEWKCGLCVKDWRYAVRIPNIDISALVTKTANADLWELMIKATHRIPNLAACKPVFYMNRTCMQMLDILGRDDVISGGQLKYEVVAGMPVTTFRGIPVRISDQITEAETTVS